MRLRCIRAATVILTLLLAPPLAKACEPAPIGQDAARIDGQYFVLIWRVEPAPLKLGEFFAVHVSACEKQARRVSRLKVDVTMPAHNHGMNYLPTITNEGNSTFAARGMLLHMPGRWEFAFDVGSDGTRERLRADFDLR